MYIALDTNVGFAHAAGHTPAECWRKLEELGAADIDAFYVVEATDRLISSIDDLGGALPIIIHNGIADLL